MVSIARDGVPPNRVLEIHREWITAGLFGSMGFGYRIDPRKSKMHSALFISLHVATIVFGIAYLYSR